MSLEDSKSDIEERPRLRLNLQILPAQVQGEKMLVFQDPEGWCEDVIILPANLAPLLQFFDGTRSFREIQEEIMRQTQELVPADNIRELAQELDEHLLLDSNRFRDYVRSRMKEWMETRTRAPVLAGTTYPSNSSELKKFLDDFYLADSGPGMPQENRTNELKAIVAPHIELRGNGEVYAYAYKRLYEESQAELFIILGTGHHPLEDMLVFSEKDFETPFGVVETDRGFIQAVRKRMKKRAHAGDFSHRKEHSIEIQLVFLQHLLLGKRNFKIVPALVGNFQTMIELGISPAEDLLFKDYLDALKEQIKDDGRKIALIASADLAHLGPRYGDREFYAPIREDEIKSDDGRMLSYLERCDADGFFQSVASDKDTRKICGLAPIYFTFKLAEPKRAELLKWSAWFDSATKSAVSFCAMALY